MADISIGDRLMAANSVAGRYMTRNFAGAVIDKSGAVKLAAMGRVFTVAAVVCEDGSIGYEVSCDIGSFVVERIELVIENLGDLYDAWTLYSAKLDGLFR